MDAFAYLSVLISIILGLAVQQVLQGYRALILSRRRIRFYAPPLIWSVLLLLMVAQNWWGSFGLAGRTEWSFALFATILVQTILLYMMAAIVLPDIPSDEPIDLRDHYYREARAFFGISGVLILWSLLREYMLEGGPAPAARLALLRHLLLALPGGRDLEAPAPARGLFGGDGGPVHDLHRTALRPTRTLKRGCNLVAGAAAGNHYPNHGTMNLLRRLATHGVPSAAGRRPVRSARTDARCGRGRASARATARGAALCPRLFRAETEMRRPHLSPRGKLVAGAAFLGALAAGLIIGSRAFPDRGPASPAELNRIAARNEEAATVAAARMKSESEAAASATDARLHAEDEAREQAVQNALDQE